MTYSTLSRRRFMSAIGCGLAGLPLVSAPGFAQTTGSGDGNILILIELSGGNDGLNTVIPVTDSAYRALRPTIGIAAQDALSLDADTALHPSLRPLADIWEDGALKIVEGVGYPEPNRSHFRSIEIWNAGLGADSLSRRGWISNAFAAPDLHNDLDAQGLVLGGDMGPLSGAGRFGAIRDEDAFLETLANLPGQPHAVRPKTVQSPLAHVLATYENAQITGDAIRRKLAASQPRQWDFPFTSLGEQLRTAARLLDAGVQVPVLKVVQDGYDTHDAQPYIHAELLTELSEAISAFARAMQQMGLWDRITLMTYSEFGRTARENGSAGTDHGTAAPVLALGGAVAGGLSGRKPDLTALVDDDLAHTTDYRQVYAAVMQDLWQISPNSDLSFAGPPITLLR